jgi:hypothetical protein
MFPAQQTSSASHEANSTNEQTQPPSVGDVQGTATHAHVSNIGEVNPPAVEGIAPAKVDRPWPVLTPFDQDHDTTKVDHRGRLIQVPRNPVLDIACPVPGCELSIQNTFTSINVHLYKVHATMCGPEGKTPIECPLCVINPPKRSGKNANRTIMFKLDDLADHFIKHYVRTACPECDKIGGAETSNLIRHWEDGACNGRGGKQCEIKLHEDVKASFEIWETNRKAWMAEHKKR